MRILDSHQHFWAIGGPGQSWPDAGWPRLYRDFGPDELRRDTEGVDLDGSVLVQAQPMTATPIGCLRRSGTIRWRRQSSAG